MQEEKEKKKKKENVPEDKADSQVIKVDTVEREVVEVEKAEPKQKNKIKVESPGNLIIVALIAVVLTSALIGGVAGFTASKAGEGSLGTLLGDAEKTGENSKEGKLTTRQLEGLVAEEVAVINAVDEASVAVVSIIVTKDVPKMNNNFAPNPFSNDPFFNPFGFRQERQQEDLPEPETEKKEIGGGSGFIVSEDGYIVTNRHVVNNDGAEYTVVMNNGEKHEAQVLARDPMMDLAILKVDAKDLPVLKMGNSEDLKIGQTVIAIGNSLGEFRNTVSKGIVSGLKRDVNAGNGFGQSELLEEVIQTDAAINPGNSGGPIVNLRGEVVGVNVAIALGAENIGFAIPVNEVKKIYDSVKEHGKIVRPYLGIRYVMNNEEIKEANDLDVDYGAIIIRGARPADLAVVPGSPADKADIVENDIILEIDGQKIDGENDLSRIIRKKSIGDTVILKVLSKGEEKTVTVVLEEIK